MADIEDRSADAGEHAATIYQSLGIRRIGVEGASPTALIYYATDPRLILRAASRFHLGV